MNSITKTLIAGRIAQIEEEIEREKENAVVLRERLDQSEAKQCELARDIVFLQADLSKSIPDCNQPKKLPKISMRFL